VGIVSTIVILYVDWKFQYREIQVPIIIVKSSTGSGNGIFLIK
jgi:hypothetical protein